MLRIAVQAKGRLFEETMALLEESDIKLSTTKRTLLVQSSNFPIEVLFLRDDDIPQTVATGDTPFFPTFPYRNAVRYIL